MKIEKIKEILSLGESQDVEFKIDCRNINAIGQSVCGFLNTQGGYIVCGADDKGRLIGVDGSDDAKSSLEKKLHEGLSPKAFVAVQTQDIDGISLIVIEVPAGKDMPYAFRDVIYLRDGGATRKADIETIQDMVLRKQVEPERWERRFSSADPERDLDMDELRSAVANILKVRRALFRDSENPYGVLEDMSLAKYGRLTNGGDILFGRNPAIRFPQARVRAVCFTTDKAADTYRDMKSFEGPLVPVLEQTFDFIVRNTPTKARFPKNGLQRQDEFLYPADAIREGLINAFSHRDYADSSGGIGVHIYPSRLEIWNSGSLPEAITPENLIHGNLSVLRNPDIAHVLYLRGFMEKHGRGIVLILRACKERGLPLPHWTSDAKTGVTLTFFAPEVAPEVTPEVTPEVLRVLGVFKGEMSRQDLQRLLGLKDDEHFRKAYLLPAIKEGVIEMTLPDKPRSSRQRYRLSQKGRSLYTASN
jgi:ATP-dependent DNA helicase RecG